ncbi:MAG: PASTA domain-containing protein [Candidatus Latescibacteria bacterium]|nr:PASTA domain-containing protein [Candidatus Latescibacterota bacterium]
MSFSREMMVCAAGSVLSLVTGAIFLNYVIMPAVVRHGDVVSVPDVAGRPVREAEETLKREGFGFKVGETRYDPNTREGRIVAQSPRPKALAKRGRRVYLTISRGEQLHEVPDIQGVSLRQAELQLRNSGFKVGRVTYRSSEDIPRGVIVSQHPLPGDSVGRGVPVNLTVSTGSPEPTPGEDATAEPSTPADDE